MGFVAKLLFSEVGLFVMILAYVAIGAWVFIQIEGNDNYEHLIKTRDRAREIAKERAALVARIVEYKRRYDADTIGTSYHNGREWIRQALDKYHFDVAVAVKQLGYDGEVHEELVWRWTFTSSVLFTTSIVTMIGYGHVAPVTGLGQIFCVVYALMGVPFMLIFVTQLGDAGKKLLYLIHYRVLCAPCRSRRMKSYQLDEAKRPAEAETEGAGNEVVLFASEGGAVAPKNDEVLVDEHGEEMGDPKYPPSLMSPKTSPVPVFVVILCLLIYNMIGGVLFSWYEGWTMVEANYFCFVSQVTLGFGDYVPGMTTVHTTKGKAYLWFASLYLVLGLAFLGMGINVIIVNITLRARAAARAAGIVKTSDADGDGVDDADEELMKKNY